MRHLLLAASVATCFFCVLAFGLLHINEAVDVGPQDDRRVLSRIVELEELVTRLEERLEKVLEEIEERPALQRSAAGVDPEPTADAPASSSGSTKTMDFASALKVEGRESLREVVFDVVEKAHAERLEAQRLEMLRRVEAHEELRSGLYGRFNFQVNSVAEKLALSEQQTAWYYELLTTYSDHLDGLRGAIETSDSESWNTYRQSRRTLQAEFESRLAEGLDRKQLEELALLPAWLGRITPTGSGAK